MLREELQLLQEQGSYVGEVVKPMDKKKVLVKVGFYTLCCFCTCVNNYIYFVHTIEINLLIFLFQVHPEGKFVVDLDKAIDINDVCPKNILKFFHRNNTGSYSYFFFHSLQLADIQLIETSLSYKNLNSKCAEHDASII